MKNVEATRTIWVAHVLPGLSHNSERCQFRLSVVAHARRLHRFWYIAERSMDFTFAALEAALTSGFGEIVGGRLRAYLAGDNTPADSQCVHHDLLGLPLAAALLPNLGDAGTVSVMPLRFVDVVNGDRSIRLTPEDTGSHPLVGPWVPETFGEALASAFVAGAMMSDFVTDAPVFHYLEVGEDQGVTGAAMVLLFGAISVIAHYGEELPDTSLCTIRRIGCAVLRTAGENAAHCTQHKTPGAVREVVTRALAGVEALQATLH